VRIVARRCGVPERHCDDIAIEVFLKFQRHTGTITAPPVIRAWLRTTTVNLSLEHIGARASRYERPTASELLTLEGQAASPEDGYLRKESFQDLLAHVEALEPKRRAVFRAYAVEGMSIAEIVARQGIPQGTAYNRLRLAREDLQAALRRDHLVERRLWSRQGLFLLPVLLFLNPDLLWRLVELARALGAGTGFS
jgi:RNA polymerase sigma-70 factor, ECF subfamily